MHDNTIEDLLQQLEQVRREAAYYRRIAADNSERRLRETEELSALISQVNRMKEELERSRDELEVRVTERTAELLIEKSRLERASTAGRVALWEWDIASGAVEWSDVVDVLLAYAPGEFPRTHDAWTSIIHSDDHDNVVRSLNLHFSKGIPYNIEYRIRCKDGTYVWWNDVGCVQRNAKGAAVHMVGVCVDITERKRAEEARIAFERNVFHVQKLESLGVMVPGIAHDFNNIISVIIGNLELARIHTTPLPHSVCSGIEKAEQAARRALEVVRQMLAYAGKTQFEVKLLNLNGIIRENADFFRTVIPKTVTLNIEQVPHNITVEADLGQVQQIIMNLIMNASDAIGNSSGIITLSVGAQDFGAEYLNGSLLEKKLPPGRYAFMEVTDTGCGMDKDTIQRIFDPFFTTKFIGRGLGMSSVIGAVRGHDGGIFIESWIGMGTSVKILFPVFDVYLAEEDKYSGS